MDRIGSNKGMALLLVVAVISVLTAVVIRFGNTTQASMARAFHYQRETILQNMAESGIDIGCSLLYADGQANDTDTLLEDWSRLGSIDLVELGFKFEEGASRENSLQVSISDLSGLIPINSMIRANDDPSSGPDSNRFREVLVRLLMSGEFGLIDEIRARTIADSLTDWLDSDDTPLPYGAENGYYLTLEKPYIARNGPVEFLDELLFVQGIDETLLYGNNEQRGLAEYIRILGSGKININTAPGQVFRSLAGDISDEDARGADEFRSDMDSAAALGRPDWYRGLSGWPQNVVIDPGLITTKSSFFRIDATAWKDAHSTRMTAEVGRDTNEMIVYYRRWE